MTLQNILTDVARGREPLSDKLYRLTGLSVFSAEAREQQAHYRATVSELECLSDRELMDIGISRWDIHRVARESAGIR